MIRYLIKRSIRSMGFDVKRYSPKSSDEARIAAALSAHGVNLVLDVGANVGQYGRSLREIGYRGRIVSFEALSNAWEKLRIQSKDDPLWEVAPRAAIGDHDGETEIHVAANSVSSSVLPMLDAHLSAAPESTYIGAERVPLRRLDSVAAKFIREDSVLFIKIDTQGFESQVLSGASRLLARAVGLQLELSLVPLYEGQSLYDELIRRLRESYFDAWAISPTFADTHTGRLLQVDVTFFRRSGAASELSPWI